MAEYQRPLKVAIVGSGCAGLAALWALKNTRHDVYLYESASRLGGHTNTVEWKTGKYSTNVDTGFIVMNTATYPNFINFLNTVGVKIDPTEMTFSVSRDRGRFEWAGSNLATLFCQKRNLFSPRMWRMLFDIIRFNQFALDILIKDEERPTPRDQPVVNGYSDLNATIGEYLEREGYSEAFKNDYLIPMTAAVWSTSPDKCSLEFPAVTLVRFLWNHHLLSTISARPQWLTISKCGQAYVDVIMQGVADDHVFLNTPVYSLHNDEEGRVHLKLENGSTAVYDHVILATHGDQAYSIIEQSATRLEKEIMSSFKTSLNKAVLHSDLSLMPKRRGAWTSWNYLTKSSPTGRGDVDTVSLTYNMNILQHIPRGTFGDVLVTLNPLQKPDQQKTQGEFVYTHPLYTPAAIRAQARLPQIQGKRGISYAGAWTKYGFHEDGFSSGLAAARELGAPLPFTFVDSTFSRGKTPVIGLVDRIVRIYILLIQILVVDMLERLVVWGTGRGGGSRPPKRR